MHETVSNFLSKQLVDRSGDHRRTVLRRYQKLAESDFITPAYRKEQQNQHLAELLKHAQAGVPFYQEVLAGVAISPDRAQDVLSTLKAVHRREIQSDPGKFIAGSVRHAVDDHTGGSTGTPLTFKVDRATQQAREASLMWANGLAGWRPGCRIAMLWGSDRDTKAAFRNWRLNFRWWVDNMRWFNAFEMDEQEMAAFHRGMSKFRPHLIVAYAGSLQTYARFLRESAINPAYPQTSLVSSAEVLTSAMRTDVESVFHRPVFDRYGNREAGAIAAECETHGGLHVNEHDFIVEIDSQDPNHVPGPLLITYLINRAMPLVRYDTGDLAVWAAGNCACGRTTRRLARIVGRQSDTIRTAHGKLIHGEFFTHVLYGTEGVREFQFIQEDLLHYRLCVAAEYIKPDQESIWRKKITAVLGPEAVLTVEKVTTIPVLPSGKRRFTLSRLNP